MIIIQFPSVAVNFLLAYGLFCLAFHIGKVTKAIVFKIKNGTWELSPQEQKVFNLIEINQKLSAEISDLQEENNQLTKTIYKHLES